MIRGDPGAVGRERALSPEKLVALVEPIQGVDGAVVGRELQLGESQRWLGAAARVRSPGSLQEAEQI